jgi:hypothetical protein
VDAGTPTSCPFAVWTHGRLEFQFKSIARRPAFDDTEKRLEMLRRLNDEVGLQLTEDSIDYRPAVDLILFNDNARMTALLGVFDWYLAELKAASAQG